MHTEFPDNTFTELTRIINKKESLLVMFMQKALPKELLYDYFRVHTKILTNEQLWEISKQLTRLGKRLSELNIEIDVPDIPLLGIKGGEQDIQRFIYWNFLKCYWNKEQGEENSNMINFDWYSPSNAKRYSEKEFKSLIFQNKLNIEFFHKEEVCYSGRFSKTN